MLDELPTPLRLLIVLPSWVGDAAMATPTLRAVRRALPGAFIGGLCRPGIDQLLAGTDFLDELHVERASGVMGPKFAAAKIRPRRYDTALLLTNSFSTALITRIAGIPRRIGYDRDARRFLLTDRIKAPTRPDGSWAPVPAVHYYWTLAKTFISPAIGLEPGPLELATTPAEEDAAGELLRRAGVDQARRWAVFCPGGNNPAKRWPPDRFAGVADHLAQSYGITTLLNGSPAEAGLISTIAGACRHASCVRLPELGITLGSLKPLVRRACLMVTNDTGPRHIAAAFGVPLVSLFGPTDHRWTIIPTRPGAPEAILLADPTLPEGELANDHPERCRIEKIQLKEVLRAVDGALAGSVPAT